MDEFQYRDGTMHCEGVALVDLAAAYGTPLYVYSKQALLAQMNAFQQAFHDVDTVFAYAVKANSNVNILRLAALQGFGGDVVSGGELQRCLVAGMDPRKIVFSGVGKTEEELLLAARTGILSINSESLFELELLAKVAREHGLSIDVSLRLNFDIHANTSDKIKTGALDSKFGIPVQEVTPALARIREAAGALRLIGVACHVGSQILNLEPMALACRFLVQTAVELRSQGFPIRSVDVGGGLGIRYKGGDEPPPLSEYADLIKEALRGTDLKLIMEPGRVIVGNAGVAVTRVLGVKKNPVRNFVVVDAAMNDLPRFALYGAYHEIQPVQSAGSGVRNPDADGKGYDVVGPVCETGDVIGRGRALDGIQGGDLLVIGSCGAYCASMASNYNSRPIAAEILVDGQEKRVIRARQPVASLWEHEVILPE